MLFLCVGDKQVQPLEETSSTDRHWIYAHHTPQKPHTGAEPMEIGDYHSSIGMIDPAIIDNLWIA